MKEKYTAEELAKIIPGADDETAGSLLNTGTFKYYSVMRKHMDNGTCPFCDGNGLDRELNKVLRENDRWYLWENPVGKNTPETEKHYVIACKRHVLQFPDLTENERGSFMEMCNWAVQNFDISGGVIIMRFGEVKRNAGSIRHLHGNIKVPRGDLPMKETFAKSKDDLEKKGAKLVLWEKMYQAQKAGNPNPESVLDAEELAFLNKKD